MTTLRLSLYARVEREFQLEAVKRALWTLQHHGVEPETPKGISPPRWRAMLKHVAKCDTLQKLVS